MIGNWWTPDQPGFGSYVSSSSCMTCDCCGRTVFSLTWIQKNPNNFEYPTTYTKLCSECLAARNSDADEELIRDLREAIRRHDARKATQACPTLWPPTDWPPPPSPMAGIWINSPYGAV